MQLESSDWGKQRMIIVTPELNCHTLLLLIQHRMFHIHISPLGVNEGHSAPYKPQGSLMASK